MQPQVQRVINERHQRGALLALAGVARVLCIARFNRCWDVCPVVSVHAARAVGLTLTICVSALGGKGVAVHHVDGVV